MTLAESLRHHLSLMDGWIPTTVQIVAATALVLAIGWRTRRWRLVWLPWAVIVGAALAVSAYWYVASEGLAGDPAPHSLWIWIALSGVAAAVLAAGWRGARWWRRGVSVVAVPLCLLCAALALNLWTRLLPDGPDRVESADRRTAARSDRSGHGRRRCRSRAGFRPRAPWCRSTHRRCGIELQASRRAGVPATGVVCQRSAGPAADGDDDRRRVQHPRRLAAGRQRGDEPWTISPPRTAATRRCWSSSTPVERSTTTPNASTAPTATPPTTSSKIVVPYIISNFGVKLQSRPTGVSSAGRWAGRVPIDLTVMHPDMFTIASP